MLRRFPAPQEPRASPSPSRRYQKLTTPTLHGLPTFATLAHSAGHPPLRTIPRTGGNCVIVPSNIRLTPTSGALHRHSRPAHLTLSRAPARLAATMSMPNETAALPGVALHCTARPTREAPRQGFGSTFETHSPPTSHSFTVPPFVTTPSASLHANSSSASLHSSHSPRPTATRGRLPPPEPSRERSRVSTRPQFLVLIEGWSVGGFWAALAAVSGWG